MISKEKLILKKSRYHRHYWQFPRSLRRKKFLLDDQSSVSTASTNLPKSGSTTIFTTSRPRISGYQNSTKMLTECSPLSAAHNADFSTLTWNPTEVLTLTLALTIKVGQDHAVKPILKILKSNLMKAKTEPLSDMTNLTHSLESNKSQLATENGQRDSLMNATDKENTTSRSQNHFQVFFRSRSSSSTL